MDCDGPHCRWNHCTCWCHAEVSQVIPDDPQLGLATTRELLEELKARGLLAQATEEMEGRGNVTGTSGEFTAARVLEVEARGLLRYLPESILGYRTVDGDE